VASEAFSFERVDPQQTFLELDGTRIEAMPVFDAPPTDATGISGTIGPMGSARQSVRSHCLHDWGSAVTMSAFGAVPAIMPS
jgi:hypothetical protein